MEKSPNIYYVYTHHRTTDGGIFYVGKGSGIRYKSRRSRTAHWKNIVAKHGLIIKIVADNLTEAEAFALERQTIALAGRDNLCNLTDGGEGPSGHIHSDEARKNISAGTKRAFENPELIEKLRLSQIGRKHSEQTKYKQGLAKIGKKKSLKTIEKMRLCKIGIIPSSETRAKMAAARIGKKHNADSIQKMRDKANSRSPETIARQVASNTGKTRSKEARLNMSASQKGKAVECSNGMRFEKVIFAVAWLQKNGYSKASKTSISRACKDTHRIAYGLKWQFCE